MARRPAKAIVSFYCQDEQRGQRRFWLQPFGLARVLAHNIVASHLLRMTKRHVLLRVLSQNRDSASRVSLCYGLLITRLPALIQTRNNVARPRKMKKPPLSVMAVIITLEP